MSLLDAFKKKDDSDVPDVSSMVKSGMSEQDIIDNLRQQGYDSTAIKNALVSASQANNQSGQQAAQPQPRQVQPPMQNFTSFQRDDAPAPMPVSTMPMQQMQPVRQDNSKQSGQSGLSEQALDTIQQVLEQIIEEKWETSSADLNVVKTGLKNTSVNLDTMRDQMNKLGQRIDGIQNVMLGKTEEYNKTLSDVNVELQAFEKVIDRLIPTISDSIKELRDLIDDLKKAKA